MSYIDQNLMNGESVIYRGKLHWVVFVGPVIWLLIAIIFFNDGRDNAPVADFYGGIFVLISIITGLTSFINYKTSEFGITNKRVIVKVGFIRRRSIELLLNKIESIQVDQSIPGRILGFGSIVVSGTGGTKDPFRKIDAPLEFRKKAQEQIAIIQDSK